jgi:magnesium chelatase subunit D
VHLAGLLADREAAFCFLLVAAVEGALLGIGVELRRPRAVSVRLGPVGLGREDLEPYASPGDSRLTQDGLAPPGDADLAAAAALAEEAGGVRALQAAVEAVGRGLPPEGLGLAPRQAQAALSALWQGGWAAPGPTGWRLTARGHRLRAWLARHLAEVELAARAASRRLGGAGSGGAVRRGPVRVGPPAPGEPWRELAVPETVLHALTRAAGAGRLGAWRVGREDLRLRRRPSRARFDICLLVDASASMEGARMRAAQAVARHLVLTSPGRVAVIAFQERHARVAVPLTRRLAQAERGLAAIAPAGLTPLGVGLDAARRYLAGCRARHPLVFLITDGIPTAAGGEGSPLDEALAAAERLRAARMALACVGLEPHRAYLQELVRRARGRLYVVDELGPQALARLVRAERVRHGAAGRGGRRTSGP